MDLNLMPLPFEASAITGLSERLLSSHHQNNYGGAVKRLNAVRAQLATTKFADTPGFMLNGLKREELIATNSMLLHELYFASLGGDGHTMEPAMKLALDASFGGFERWREEFSACAKALGGGSGWMLLVFNPREGALLNQWAADHTHALAGGTPLLALDMYEHAYQMDFGAKAGAYVDAYMRNIHWAWAGQRFEQVAHGGAAPRAPYGQGAMPPEQLRDVLAGTQANTTPLLIDVRRKPAFEAGADMLPGAIWRAPEQIDSWAGELPKDRELLVYCVYGHNVSEDAAADLRRRGFKAQALLGGIASWHALAAPVQGKPGG